MSLASSSTRARAALGAACFAREASAMTGDCVLNVKISIRDLPFINHTVRNFASLALPVQCAGSEPTESAPFPLRDVAQDFLGHAYSMSSESNSCPLASTFKRTAQMAGTAQECDAAFPSSVRAEYGLMVGPSKIRIHGQAVKYDFGAAKRLPLLDEWPLTIGGRLVRMYGADVRQARVLVTNDNATCAYVYSCVGGTCASELYGSPFCARWETSDAPLTDTFGTLPTNHTCLLSESNPSAVAVAKCTKALCCPATDFMPQCCGEPNATEIESRDAYCAPRRICLGTWAPGCKVTMCTHWCDHIEPCARSIPSIRMPAVIECSCSGVASTPRPTETDCSPVSGGSRMSAPFAIVFVAIQIISALVWPSR